MPPPLVIGFSLLVSIGVLLMAPIVHNLRLPPDYPERTSPHPDSPHTPPQLELSPDQIEDFRRDGFVVLRQVLSPQLQERLLTAGDDLTSKPIRHCELSRWTGPPIFHAYHTYCGRAQLIHDYLRDVVYQSPLANIASQLFGSAQETTIRQMADSFLAGDRVPQRWHSDFFVFMHFARSALLSGYAEERALQICNQSLVFWMPLQPTSESTNGLIVLNQTSHIFRSHFEGNPQQVRNLWRYFQWLFRLPKNNDDNPQYAVSPNVTPGDVLAFDGCTVHASSGQHKGGIRKAYQLRFLQIPPIATTTTTHSKAWWQRLWTALLPANPFNPAAAPQLWPHTLPHEDALRQAGPVIYSKREWIRRLKKGPVYTLLNSVIHWRVQLLGDSGKTAV